jgi:serine/threonine-protein kinase RsbW
VNPPGGSDDPTGGPGNSLGEVVLDVPARPEYLSLVRQVVAAAAAVQVVRDDRIEALRIAVSEATTNAIESYAGLREAEAATAHVTGVEAPDVAERVVVRCALAEDRIEVEVLDRAGGFEPGPSVGLPPPDDPGRLDRERGLGLPLMEHLTDEATITTGDGGTTVRLVVHTPWRRRSE